MNGIYVHIPFCKTICSYCDFPKQVATPKKKEDYLERLALELKTLEAQDWFQEWSEKTKSVYIGGGTPNSLSAFQLERLFRVLEPYLKQAEENTIEINPELLTPVQAQLFKKYHINRVSIGVQTFEPSLLQELNRNHTEQIVKNCVRILKAEGISNINIDMMYGLPNQTMRQFKKDVRKILTLDVQHISYYSLILEEKTILSYQMKHSQIEFPDDDSVVNMANYLTKKLKKRQFIHYEVSNYAKKGFESIHNLGYWNCEEYIGLGASACGFHHKRRIQNPCSLRQYMESSEPTIEFISQKEEKNEFMMLGLRKLQGIPIEEYYNRFKTYPNDDFDLVSLYDKNLIEEKNGFIRIKEDKIWLGNLVFETFVGGEDDEG